MRTVYKVAVVGGAAVAAGWGLTFYQPAWLINVIAQATPNLVWIGPTDCRTVALTFDDGPDPRYTPQILAFLQLAGAKATFFLMGSHARQYPELVAQIRKEGHQIGNHMWRDENALFLNDEAAVKSLRDTEMELQLQSPKWLRPAGGFARPSFIRYARQHGYRVVVASAYASDPRLPPTAYIVWAMTRMMRPGAILVLHDAGGDRSRSVAAVPKILESGLRLGLRFATLHDLFGERPIR